jgi:hypothetical protein
MSVSSLINSFNAGEVSPLLFGRTDIEKYRAGCEELTNMVVMPFGGATRRPGTEYLGNCMDHTKRSRLIPFNFSRTTRFVIELGHQKIRFWSNGLQVMDPVTPANIYEVAAPYVESDLRDMQFVQVNDLVFFFHQNHHPRKLSRLADNDWLLEKLGFDGQNEWPPFLDENTGTGTIAASATTGTAIDLTASVATFKPEHVGSYFQIAHRRQSAFVQKTLEAVGTSNSLRCVGKWELTTYGTWGGEIRLQRSYDNGTSWETIRSYSGKKDRNVNTTGEETKECLLRVEFADRTDGTVDHRALLELQEARQFGVVRIDVVTSGTAATAKVVKDLHSTDATSFWSEGAWSDWQGYPGCGALHEGRLWLAGTKRQPQSIWASVVDDYPNFRRYVADDSALFLTLASRESQQIQWLLGRDALLVGTTSGEWTVSGGGGSITPGNVRAEQQSSYGSKRMSAVAIQDSVIFIQRNGRKVRELLLVNGAEKQGYIAPDLNILSEHVTAGEIVETAYQQNPYSVFWAVKGDGKMIGMTYERDQGVAGWHMHETKGVIESVACIYGTGMEDEVWLAVRRTINGGTVRYIERFVVDMRQKQEAGDKANLWFVDCGKKVTLSPASKVVIGLGHLEGEELAILGDGTVEPPRTVAGGQVTCQNASAQVIAGIAYTSTVRPLPLDIALNDGASMGRKAQVFRAYLRFWQSLGAQVEGNGEGWDDVFFRAPDDLMDNAPALFTGIKEVYLPNAWNRECTVAVRQILPLPMTLVALVARWSPSGE